MYQAHFSVLSKCGLNRSSKSEEINRKNKSNQMLTQQFLSLPWQKKMPRPPDDLATLFYIFLPYKAAIRQKYFKPPASWISLCNFISYLKKSKQKQSQNKHVYTSFEYRDIFILRAYAHQSKKVTTAVIILILVVLMEKWKINHQHTYSILAPDNDNLSNTSENKDLNQ